jgi:hypothetical protein
MMMAGARARSSDRRKKNKKKKQATQKDLGLGSNHPTKDEIEQYRIEIKERREKNRAKREQEVIMLKEKLSPEVYLTFEKLFAEFDDDNNSKWDTVWLSSLLVHPPFLRFPHSCFQTLLFARNSVGRLIALTLNRPTKIWTIYSE